VEIKTPTQTLTAPTAEPPYTLSVNATLEATENIIVEWKMNALACQTAA
jgi:hypothetical protein